MPNSFTDTVKKCIMQIPAGKVATYGRIAAHAGNPRAARQVARILHSCSRKDNLPWHRVVNRQGRISLSPCQGYEIQQALLQMEGIVFEKDHTIDLSRFLWMP
ncbi:MAG: methylated-DNA--[protein]-cysteine S-methyltransferase [Pseudomonadota bacterium]